MKFEAGFAGRGVMLGALGAMLGTACAARQVPPGPDPEYQRPEVAPWQEAPPEDPLKNIEADGEWVDDGAGDAGGAPASPGSAPEPAPDPNSAAPPAPGSPAPGSATPSEPGSKPAPGSEPAPTPEPSPPPSPAPKNP